MRPRRMVAAMAWEFPIDRCPLAFEVIADPGEPHPTERLTYRRPYHEWPHRVRAALIGHDGEGQILEQREGLTLAEVETFRREMLTQHGGKRWDGPGATSAAAEASA